MPTPAEVQQFIQHWERVTLNEKAVAQSHFNALCTLLGLKGPVEADPTGQFFRFEKPLTKSGGTAGFADVWYKGRFAVEYKTKGKYATLYEAYSQLELYKDDLANPPVLMACDIARYEVHIVFTGYSTRIHKFTNRDLENASIRELLRLAFTNPEALRPVEPAETVTKHIAGRFARIAELLEGRGFAPAEIAHFFMKVLFALFAEDIRLLPAELMSKSIRRAILNPEEFPDRARALFRAMREGGYFGEDRVPRFNGWLFDDDEVLPLNADELALLEAAARHDWQEVEPGIFGTLFERGLDRAKRAQLGAHYTSREDILLIVEPVLMRPLRREWENVKDGVAALRNQWEPLTGNAQRRLKSIAEEMILSFVERLATVRVLDPACGSGNFLYVALTELKDLEKEVWDYAGVVGLPQPELTVGPAQFFGIEKNPFAAELAQVVVWIGYLQWVKTRGFLEGWPKEPVLSALHTIENRDAILAVGRDGQPMEPAWPEVDVIIGNPPFLGSKRLRGELGSAYVNALQTLYGSRVPASMDLVMYWFERARAQLATKQVNRVGLLATNSIRQQRNRVVLERIKQAGAIFMAWSDRPWILEGAAVRVSMVGFDNGTETIKHLNGIRVSAINADLTSDLSIADVCQLPENVHVAFMGNIKIGPFDLTALQAAEMLALTNASGRLNRDVVRPLAGGDDITGRPKDAWIIDFGPTMPESEAVLYEVPFAYVKEHVKPEREKNNRASYRRLWWLHGEPRPALWQALRGKTRCIVTVLVAKHRLFAWLPTSVSPAARLIVFAREDDYFFGVLHARAHEMWTLRMGARHGVGNDPTYNISSCFDTFPFPWAPGTEPTEAADLRVHAIAAAARALVTLRDEWLNPSTEGALDGVNLKERTLTNLYNQRPDWLTEAHRRLDEAVFAAYGWASTLSDEELLAQLLALNLERAKGQGAVARGEEEA